ncbi:P-loop containing nucleoside triphosphate hydrolase protein [Rozella allomycis CSF55]|uniref:ABC transporter domain-containing protein n=1 Tax=Rozella allomycis (strain CSF55) TaxID=988480 RepID=A0A075B0G4_ROZAC|nr:ABC transporter domain-containing protein [Rozella allomycis CSF55]RKP18115.1 P-loop containing nucleoside triphosphate hydrolase protein [Rozella allomycis CSF55]|eukprot:EPZ34284.1 ABC transporter domain-containing protein [Rozella allomycis CSF55]
MEPYSHLGPVAESSQFGLMFSSASYLETKFPSVDSEILEYVNGIIRDEDVKEELFETIGPILIDSSGLPEEEIESICKELSKLLGRVEDKVDDTSLKRLEETFKMKDIEEIEKKKVSISHIQASATRESLVDQEQLRKSEEKRKLKAEKRGINNFEATEFSHDKKVDETTWVPVDDDAKRVRDVRVENFDIGFAGKRILSNATLSLNYGRRYGLIGRNGIGKSTLLKAIATRQIDIPRSLSILHVEQEIVGDDTTALQCVIDADLERNYYLNKEADLLKRLGDNYPDDKKKEKALSELPLVQKKLMDIESDTATTRASKILSGLGFSMEMQQKPTRTFSGGWRMRLSLARALFMKPDLLLLDEPTNTLDIVAMIWLENYLLSWPKTVLVVSHDRSFLEGVTTDIIHLKDCNLAYYKGNYSTFLAAKEDRMKNQQREYENQLQYRQHLQSFIDRFRYNAKRAAQAQSKIKILEKLPELAPVVAEGAIHFNFPDPEFLNPPLLQLQDVEFGYDSARLIIKDVNLNVDMSSRIAIIGANGSGKTTILKLITEQLKPSKGQCYKQSKVKVSLFSQHHIDQLDLNVSSVEHLQTCFPGYDQEFYRGILGSFGITGATSLQSIRTLSGGQKSRVVFAKMAMENPHIMILDEPTNHLDMDSIEALLEALKVYKGGVLVVAHDERFVQEFSTDIYVCANQKLSKWNKSMAEYKKSLKIDL